MSLTSNLGYLAGFLTTVAFIPQVVKTWKTKSARDISLGMFVTFCASVFCWLLYGFMINEGPVILWNLVTLALAMCILGMKLKYK
ncbi:hypothetical protein UR09_00690 [Candidatus Nitromaritima sp. SCGC AAA799-A02]|nr:hypothetical protein UR09_00690 [Candidatus Nitromaritima sp. SCGC AAA799-A02]